MPIFLHALSLKNYRGIGAEAQYIGPFKSCNFFIGTNNSGKSCILNFISRHLTAASQQNRLTLSPLEVHLGAVDSQMEVGFGVPLEVACQEFRNLLNDRPSDLMYRALSAAEKLLTNLSEGGIIWTSAGGTDLNQIRLKNDPLSDPLTKLDRDEWKYLWQSLTAHSGGDLKEHWVPQVASHVARRLMRAYPAPKIIPAKRQIGVTGESFDDFSGEGLIDRLAELQNPRPTERHLKNSFEKINRFLQDVTGDKTAMIEIPHDRHEVLVHKGERVLPLSSLGTGIHEVVMIATFCTLTENGIVCIEEPEIHLHPLLQKKLIRYINANTSNQYFIATHSASVIDQANAAVFHVTHEEAATKIRLLTAAAQRFQVCHDLGYRASDLLQANAIIWVEGPSDRVYLKHWIAAVDPSLQEGIHFSVMFYGGRLLSHLGANDDEVSEFISLRRLNRNMAIIIDSDKKTAQSRLNDTKTRIVREFEEASDPAWITAGREIENYVPNDVLSLALSETYLSFLETQSDDKYAHHLYFYQKGPKRELQTEVDKVKVARAVCKYPADLTVLDLQKQVGRIVKMIQAANA